MLGAWTITDNYNEIINNTNPNNLSPSSSTYTSTQPDRYVKSVTLGTRDTNYLLDMEIYDLEHNERLMSEFQREGFFPYAIDGSLLFEVDLTDSLQACKFIVILAQAYPEINELTEKICEAIHVDHFSFVATQYIYQIEQLTFDNVLQQAFDEYYFSSQVNDSEPPPAISLNQQALDALELKPDVPEEFLCAIASTVMDEPVFDPNLPDVKFDRAQIEHWLKTNETNPYNRQPLLMNALKADEALKGKIAQFIANAKNPISNPKPIVNQYKLAQQAANEKPAVEAAQEPRYPTRERKRAKRCHYC